MKAAGVIVLTATLLLSIGVLADERHDRKLWVAIDDGTEDGSLFISLDGYPVGSSPAVVQVADSRVLEAVAIETNVPTNAITIISDRILDDKVRKELETLLSRSGHTGRVVFVDRSKISSTEENATN